MACALSIAACTSAAPGEGTPMTPAPPASAGPGTSVGPPPRVTQQPSVELPSSADPLPSAPTGTALPPAGAVRDAIAYVPADKADSIRLVALDGTGDSLVWEHGPEDPSEVDDVWSLEWSPDARELTFASTHENWCSINASDVFVVAADGSGYRRVTQAPACADLGGYPSGAVRMPTEYVSFTGDTFFGFVYVQGAPSIVPAALAPGGRRRGGLRGRGRLRRRLPAGPVGHHRQPARLRAGQRRGRPGR